MASGSSTILPEDQVDDLLHFARTGDLEELSATVRDLSGSLKCSPHAILAAATDPESGNSTLHMSSANGHADVIQYILTQVSTTPSSQTKTSSVESVPAPKGGTLPSTPVHPLIDHPNSSQSTPLHWAAVNGHLDCVKLIVEIGRADMTLENAAKHDALYEAERAGKNEIVEWLTWKMGGSNGVKGEAVEGNGSGEAASDEAGKLEETVGGKADEDKEREIRDGVEGLAMSGSNETEVDAE